MTHNKKPSLNGPCTCGSGKKYKRCCGIKGKNVESEDHFFKKLGTSELLKIFSGLSVLPENHGKNVRLNLLISRALLHYNNKRDVPTQQELENFLNRYYPEHSAEDPATNLFTDRVTFYGGDFLLFPGITGTGNFTLANLLTTIFHRGDTNLPKEFISNCCHGIDLLLRLSNQIANSLGHTRYMTGVVEGKKIAIPNRDIYNKLLSSVSISEGEMLAFLHKHNIAKEALQPFLIGKNEPGLDSFHVENSPVLTKPIFYDQGQYIVVSPTNINYALVDFIWEQAKYWKCFNELNEAYHIMLWNEQQLRLNNMGFRHVKCSIKIKPQPTLPIYWAVFEFDDDKLAVIQYIYDKGENYISRNHGRLDEKIITAFRKEVFGTLRASPEYQGFEFFDLVMTSSIGRGLLVAVNRLAGARLLVIPVPEFEILATGNECNAIDLWKFAIARQEQMPHTMGITFSFLDYYKIYKEHHDSFYLSDENKFTHLYLEDGYGAAPIQQQVKKKSDVHAVQRKIAGRLAYIIVERKDEYAPIYLSREELMSRELYVLVEGFRQPIWVTPEEMPESTNAEIRKTIWEFTDAIAYWLWQITPHIKDIIAALGATPLIVSFILKEVDKFESLDVKEESTTILSERFEIALVNDGFRLTIPHEIIPYLNRADNEGERILVKHLIGGFNTMLHARDMQIIGPDTIDVIVDTAAPYGQKKKFYIIDSTSNLFIDPRHLPRYRYIQEYDTGVLLDKLVPLLGSDCPPVGVVKTKEEKITLARNIVAASLKYLTEKISQYNCEELLQRLIGMSESLIHKQEEIKISTPTRLACYLSSQEMLADLAENQQKANRTTIAIRCLTEHVAAEQVIGTKIVSTCALDELIAIMENIITWGSLADQLNFDLFDIQIGVLPTGRIGTEKKEFREIFDPYHSSKTQENLADAIKLFSRNFMDFSEYTDNEFPENINKAFNEDYGVSFLRLCVLIDALAEIGANQPNNYCVLPFADLFDAINKILDPQFSQEEFDAAIAYLTLSYRESVTKKPKGFDNIDISPWRFNRRLSLLRRPIIKMEHTTTAIPLAYWGFREVLLTKRYIYESIESGRLKVDEGSKLSKIMGKLANERGDTLVDEVKNLFIGEHLIVDAEVTIAPKGKLKNEKDIGDVDCLIIDTDNKVIHSLECKSMAPSRNIKEMVEEMSKLLGSESEKGWINKHLERDKWLKENIAKVSKVYNLDLAGYRINSLFVTKESMLTPHLKKEIPIPFITLYDVERNGIAALQ